MRDDSILERLAEAEDAETGAALFMYHGTAAAIGDSPLRPGPYDGVFWMADRPSIAQTYLPASGIQLMIAAGRHELSQRVRPDLGSALYQVVRQMGFEAKDIKFEPGGIATSYSMAPDYPRVGEALGWLRDKLGYELPGGAGGRPFMVKASFAEGECTILPASFSTRGRLFIIDGWQDLRFHDMTGGGDGDLMDPDHNKLDDFREAEEAGFDGVIINDFAQSGAHWGNLGHRSWGVFRHALPRLVHTDIPCVRYDFPPDTSALARRTTPEFETLFDELALAGAPRP